MLPEIGNKLIKFNHQSIYGIQCSSDNSKQRIIRRVNITMDEIRSKFINLLIPIDDCYSKLNKLDGINIPHNFICPILYEIMKDPVKTSDGFTYEKMAIEKWFLNNNLSPLTGINLNDKNLISNTELKEQILKFISEI